MRIKRGKKYHKYVNFWRVVYKFHPPYKVLIDGNFFHHACKEAIDIKHQLSKILQDQPFIFMTKCIMRELENLGRNNIIVEQTLKQARLTVKLPCGHSGGIVDPDECIMAYIGKRNENKAFVATNDEELRNKIRNNGSAPLFFYNKSNVLIMDSPSDVSEAKFKIREQMKLEPTKAEKMFLKGQEAAIFEQQMEELEEQ